jgi:hypothetical protein
MWDKVEMSFVGTNLRVTVSKEMSRTARYKLKPNMSGPLESPTVNPPTRCFLVSTPLPFVANILVDSSLLNTASCLGEKGSPLENTMRSPCSTLKQL